MLVVVERRKADQGFPKGHQNGPRHGQQPWRRIGREPNGNTGSQGSKMKTPRNQPRNQKPRTTGGGKDRERKKEEKEKRREEGETGNRGMGKRGIILTSLL